MTGDSGQNPSMSVIERYFANNSTMGRGLQPIFIPLASAKRLGRPLISDRPFLNLR